MTKQKNDTKADWTHPRILNHDTLGAALAELEEASPTIRRMTELYGAPPAWRREPGFASLVYTILEQQVSLASARAVYERLLAIGPITPKKTLELNDSELRAIGFSRQKISYCKNLALLVSENTLDLERLTDLGDESVRSTLIAIKGIGPWTADIYLLHSLGRPDIWPVGDLALRIAAEESLELQHRPTEEELLEIGEEFRPWRSVAARVFWHGYLTRRGISEVD